MKQDNTTMEQIEPTEKKVWNEPEIILLSVKDNTLGGGSTSPDALVNS